LLKGFPSKVYPDLRVDNFTMIGCDLIDAPTMIDTAGTGSVDAECRKWRASWPKTFAEHGNERLLIVGDAHFLTAHRVDGAQVQPGTAAMERLLFRTLDDIRGAGVAGGARQVSVMNIPCRRIDPQRLDPALRSFAAQGSNDAMVDWTNGVIARWAQARGASLLDVHSRLCADGFTPTRNGIPLYHDTLHFSPEAAAMIWTWLAPTVRDTDH
jgi:hypothetical protein